MQIKTQVTIQRPRDEVYRRLADDLASTYPLVCPITSVKLDPDKPIAVGVTGQNAGTGTMVTTITEAPAIGSRWLQGWNQMAVERHERQDAQRLKALLEGRQKDPAKAYRRSMVRLVLSVGRSQHSSVWLLPPTRR